MAHLWSGRFEGGSRRRAVRVRRVVPVRSPAVRRRRDGAAWRGLKRSSAPACCRRRKSPRSSGALDEILARWRRIRPSSMPTPRQTTRTCTRSSSASWSARVGDAGRRLHTGRSRNEQVVARSAAVSEAPGSAAAAGDRSADSTVLGDQAVAAGDALMPSYTHLRRAQPVLAAHFFLAHAAALRRDHGRFDAAARRGRRAAARLRARLPAPAIGIDVRGARRAGSASRASSPNSIDATGDRDFVSSFLHAAALTMVHLSRLAEDLILFTSEEFGFFELADTAATGSSLMPQKKNPDPLELVRGKSGRVIGRLTGWLATMKGLPIGYSKDLQEDKEALFEAEDTLQRLARRSGHGRRAASRSIASVTGDGGVGAAARDRCGRLPGRARACRSATRTRSSGRWSGGWCRRADRFDALTLDEWRAHSPLFDADVQRLHHAVGIGGAASARRSRPTRTQWRRRSVSCARGWKLRVSREKAKGEGRTPFPLTASEPIADPRGDPPERQRIDRQIELVFRLAALERAEVPRVHLQA